MLVALCVVFLRDFYVKSVLGIARKKILERGVNFSCSLICSKNSSASFSNFMFFKDSRKAAKLKKLTICITPIKICPLASKNFNWRKSLVKIQKLCFLADICVCQDKISRLSTEISPLHTWKKSWNAHTASCEGLVAIFCIHSKSWKVKFDSTVVLLFKWLKMWASN